MYFLLLGIVLLVMWYAEIGPVAAWPWYFVFAPFALAVIWWWWADMTGYSKRKVIERENEKKKARIDKSREAMGIVKKKR